MIFIQYKDNREYTFELKSSEREVDFCIIMNEAISNACRGKVFTITNVHGLTRQIKSNEVNKCLYTKGRNRDYQKESVSARS